MTVHVDNVEHPKIIRNVLLGLFTIGVSFGITGALIDYWRQSPGASALAIALASDGVRETTDFIRGNVDSLQADQYGRIELTGWAFDSWTTKPVDISVLVGKRLERVARTNGPRADVKLAFRLTNERAKDLAFSGRTTSSVGCGRLTVVAIDVEKRYSVIGRNVQVRCGSDNP